ncbi:MAG: response regulator, partial [Alphaproteobacteria bacterium]|nr:response regulator [Alphaproteobacteria bacterium]
KRMLAFARRQELKPESVDVARQINGMTEMLRRSLGPMIEISFEHEEVVPLVMVDPNQLELAVLNLVLNSRDAMPNGGRITIAARSKSVGEPAPQNLAPGRYVCLTVTDTGTGMDETTLKRAPEPFFTTKGPDKGTGLGLSTVYGLASQSGGMARISSKIGVGTQAELWLPVAGLGVVDEAGSPAAHITPTNAPLSILLVDDDRLVAESTMLMLEHLGHRVLVAFSGAEAMTLLDARPAIDVVITDNAMPGTTGVELASRIRQSLPGLPIILATGYAEIAPDQAAGLPRLSKPYRLDELSSMLAKLMDEREIPQRRSLGKAASG